MRGTRGQIPYSAAFCFLALRGWGYWYFDACRPGAAHASCSTSFNASICAFSQDPGGGLEPGLMKSRILGTLQFRNLPSRYHHPRISIEAQQ